MSDQPTDPTAAPSDPTAEAPVPGPESPSIDTPSFEPRTAPAADPAPAEAAAASPAEAAAYPPAQGSYPPPPGTYPPPPGAYAPSAPAAPAGPPPPANPYGGYAAAPPASAGYGQVSVGSLPYVEHHFGPVTTFGDRILPAIIDGLLTLIGLVPFIIGIIVMAASSASTGYYDDYGNYQPGSGSGAGVGVGLLLMFLGLALIVGIWVWNRVLKMGRTGQSVGKKMFGQKLVNATTGQPIGPGQAFIRELIHSLANQIVYLSYLWMLWDANRQTLGDLVVKSTVIKVPKA